MRYIFVFFTLCLLTTINDVNAENWLDENYDIHLTCKLESACGVEGDCKNFNDGYSQTLHFSLGADKNNWRKYRTCNDNFSLDIRGRLPRECYSDWMDDKSDGMWVFGEEGFGSKLIVKSYGPNIIYAIDHPSAFNLEVSDYDGTMKGKYGLLPGSDVIEYFIDNTRGTLKMRYIDRCGTEECEGVYLKDGRTFIKHREAYSQFFSCQPIKGKLF